MPVDSPNDSKPLREIKQMLNLEKESSKVNSENNSSHTFTPTSNVRNGFRRKKGDSPFTYNLNLKVKKEKKQSNFTNPDPWARIVGSRNTAAVYMSCHHSLGATRVTLNTQMPPLRRPAAESNDFNPQTERKWRRTGCDGPSRPSK